MNFSRKYDTIKLFNGISLNFPEFCIRGTYVKTRFKNRDSPYYVLSFRGQKLNNITNIKQKKLCSSFFWYKERMVSLDQGGGSTVCVLGRLAQVGDNALMWGGS